MIISPKPEKKSISINASSKFIDLDAPLNSFQINIPHKAATIVAPCPKA